MKKLTVIIAALALLFFCAGQAAATNIGNGSGPPSAAMGVDGDFYFDTVAQRLYGPKSGGAWPSAAAYDGKNPEFESLSVGNAHFNGKPFIDPTHPIYGATGDGSTDDTAALQAAIDAAIANNAILLIPAGTFKFTQLTIAETGFVMRGAGTYRTTLSCTATSDAIVFEDPSGSDETRNPLIGDLSIDGPGFATSTGAGVKAAYAANYNGSNLKLDNVSIRYFNYGVYLDWFDQVYINGSRIEYNNYNFYLNNTGACNTLSLISTSTSNATNTGILAKSGAGITILGGDHVNQESIRAQNAGTQITVIGGNFENNGGADDAAWVAESNTSILGMGNRFLRSGAGTEASPCRVKSNGRILLLMPEEGGYSSPLLYKEGAGIAQIIAPNNSDYSGGNEISEAGATSFRGDVIPSRVGPNPPAAGATFRGMPLRLMQTDAGNIEDRLLYYIRLRDDSYEAVDLVSTRHLYSLTGASHARVQQMRQLAGTKTFDTDAAAYTDVIVTVGAFNQFYSATANILDSSGRSMFAVITGSDSSAGTVTFRVHHASDTGGSISVALLYNISVGY